MRVVRTKAEYFVGRLQRYNLLSSDLSYFLSGLAVVKRRRDRLRPMVNVQVSSAVGNHNEGKVRRRDAVLPLLLRSLDIAECVEGADVLPADWPRIVAGGDFRLPDKSVDVVSETHSWQSVDRQQGVEQPLITACVHLYLQTNK